MKDLERKRGGHEQNTAGDLACEYSRLSPASCPVRRVKPVEEAVIPPSQPQGGNPHNRLYGDWEGLHPKGVPFVRPEVRVMGSCGGVFHELNYRKGLGKLPFSYLKGPFKIS